MLRVDLQGPVEVGHRPGQVAHPLAKSTSVVQDRGDEPPCGTGQGPVVVCPGAGKIALLLPHAPAIGQRLGVVRPESQGAIEVGGGLGQLP